MISGVAQAPIRDMEAYKMELSKRIAAVRERASESCAVICKPERRPCGSWTENVPNRKVPDVPFRFFWQAFVL